MISYKIISRELRQRIKPTSKQPLKVDDPRYRELLLASLIKKSPYKEGQRVRKHGSRLCGVISQICYDADECLWQGYYPHFIEVFWDNNTLEWCRKEHLSLKKVTK